MTKQLLNTEVEKFEIAGFKLIEAVFQDKYDNLRIEATGFLMSFSRELKKQVNSEILGEVD